MLHRANAPLLAEERGSGRSAGTRKRNPSHSPECRLEANGAASSSRPVTSSRTRTARTLPIDALVSSWTATVNRNRPTAAVCMIALLSGLSGEKWNKWTRRVGDGASFEFEELGADRIGKSLEEK